MPLRNLGIIFLTMLVSLACYHRADRSRFPAVFADAYRTVHEQYVKPVDRRDLFEGAMDGMLDRLDRNSTYSNPVEHLEMVEDLDQKFPGLGIVVELDERTQRIAVVSVLPDMPAERAGMKPGDVIVSIDGRDTEGLGLSEATRLLKGKAGTQVVVAVSRPDHDVPIELTVTREVIVKEYVRGDVRSPDGQWRFVLEEDPRIGYIRIQEFGENTDDELAAALASIEGEVDGLILDVRNNPGGYLHVAVKICDMFVDRGVIVSTLGRGGVPVQPPRNADPEATTVDGDLPLAVLANRNSASASEIAAACLQDHSRAIVVGERTFGKGTVQNIYPLEGGRSAMKLTTATYWRPSGKDIHRFDDSTEEDDWGVRPSEGYLVELSDQQLKAIAKYRHDHDYDFSEPKPADDQDPAPSAPRPEDPQLKKAVEYIRKQAEIRRNAA